MASERTLRTRLGAFGFTLENYRRAREFFEKRRFHLGYGGRGKYRGHFHLSASFPENGGARWECYRVYNPALILDNPAEIMKKLAAAGKGA